MECVAAVSDCCTALQIVRGYVEGLMRDRSSCAPFGAPEHVPDVTYVVEMVRTFVCYQLLICLSNGDGVAMTPTTNVNKIGSQPSSRRLDKRQVAYRHAQLPTPTRLRVDNAGLCSIELLTWMRR